MAMTDEERARMIASMIISSGASEVLIDKWLAGAFAAIRADERENCAREVEEYVGHDAGEVAICRNEALRRAAAAIRARGSE